MGNLHTVYSDTPEYFRGYRARWRMGAFRNGLAWTDGDRSIALDMRQRGKSYSQVAMRLGRTPDAVAAHLRALRLREEGR